MGVFEGFPLGSELGLAEEGVRVGLEVRDSMGTADSRAVIDGEEVGA